MLPVRVEEAARHGNLRQVVEWLQKGGHVDALANAECLLHAAADNGRLHIARELLTHGASLDLRGSKGATSLMLAACKGHHAMMLLLLEHKAGIDLQNASGFTTLMGAAAHGHTECVQELLEANASTELRDQQGLTALHRAETRPITATAQLLWQHTAKPPAPAALSNHCCRT